MTEEQIRSAARSLVSSGVTTLITDTLRQKFFEQWRATSPEQHVLRESIYQQQRGLEILMGSIEALTVDVE